MLKKEFEGISLDELMNLKEVEDELNDEVNDNMNEDVKDIIDSTTFDDIIGYEKYKKQLKQILGFIHNKENYQKLKVEAPKGIVLNGAPGVGKTMLASAFINDSKLPSFIIHRVGDDSSFPKIMKEIFEKASLNAPSIILLDDMDKFNGKERDKTIFNTLQSLIDSVRNKEVYIIATVNDDRCMPKSLLRSGRFDFKIDVDYPSKEDVNKLINYFIKDRPISSSVNIDDITSAISDQTPINIKSTINKAMMIAASKSKEEASIEDFLEAFLEVPLEENEWKKDERKLEETAFHEAGHCLISEICNKGSVGFVSVISSRLSGGMNILKHNDKPIRRPHYIITSLGGKVAVETNLSYLASGCYSDIDKASTEVATGLRCSALGGYQYVYSDNDTPELDSELANVAAAKLKYYEDVTRCIINSNKPLLNALVDVLKEKGYLLASDIAKLEEVYPLDNKLALSLY